MFHLVIAGNLTTRSRGPCRSGRCITAGQPAPNLQLFYLAWSSSDLSCTARRHFVGGGASDKSSGKILTVLLRSVMTTPRVIVIIIIKIAT